MSLDIEIVASTLLSLVQGDLQTALFTTCLPSFPPYYIDHADVTTGTLSVTSGGVVQLEFPVNVFVDDQTSLLANANGTPPGAGPPPLGQVTIGLQVTIAKTVFSLTCNSVTGAIVPPATATQIQTTIGTVGSFDLAPVFSSLGLPTPTTSTIVQSGSNLFVRFDPSGSPVDHLQKGEQWCLFLDSATVVAVVENQLNGILTKVLAAFPEITSASISSITWAPSGTVPHVNVAITGKVNVPNPLKGDFELDLGIDFALQSLIPFPDADLLEIVTWSFSISTGLFFVNNAIESAFAAMFNATLFGGTPIGPNEFSIAQSLPPLTLGSASFAYAIATGLADGMVLGGAVAGIPAVDTSILSLNVAQFPSQFVLIGFCEGGSPAPTPVAVSTTASAFYFGAGKLCSVSVLSPTTFDITPYLGLAPAPGAITNSGSITLSFNALIAQAVISAGQPVELLLQTTRGVRIINFGTPPTPQYGANGNVTNYHEYVIDNCPVAVDPWFQIFHAFNPLWRPDPGPDWFEAVEQVAAFESSLIRVTGLQTGELITFNQAIDGGLSVVSAGELGAATVPAVLAFRSVDEQAALVRANRQTLGTPDMPTMVFQRIATINTPGAVSHQLSGGPLGASVTTTYASGAMQTVFVDSLGILSLAGNQVAVAGAALKPGVKPLEPRVSAAASASAPAQDAGSTWSLTLPGLVKILTVPGFETAPVAVAQMSDGTYLVVEHQSDGTARVAGLVPRWPDIPPVSRGWAISSATGNRIAVFTVQSAASGKCSCGC